VLPEQEAVEILLTHVVAKNVVLGHMLTPHTGVLVKALSVLLAE